MQPRPQGALEVGHTSKAREKSPGDEVEAHDEDLGRLSTPYVKSSLIKVTEVLVGKFREHP